MLTAESALVLVFVDSYALPWSSPCPASMPTTAPSPVPKMDEKQWSTSNDTRLFSALVHARRVFIAVKRQRFTSHSRTARLDSLCFTREHCVSAVWGLPLRLYEPTFLLRLALTPVPATPPSQLRHLYRRHRRHQVGVEPQYGAQPVEGWHLHGLLPQQEDTSAVVENIGRERLTKEGLPPHERMSLPLLVLARV